MPTTQPRLAGDRVKSSVLSQRILIRDLTLSCSIGVSDEERARRQRLRINIELTVDYPPPTRDNINEVVDYGRLAKAVRNHCLSTTFRLLETLADELSDVCFGFPPVSGTKVRIEKLDRYADIGGIGVEIARRRSDA
ncbi:MAG: dihydroneopterin aldolase [Kiloniellaceae bacterium]